MAHEIIVMPPRYHLSVHYPRGSLYADVWLGINMGNEDLLIYLSPLRQQMLNTSPAEEMASEEKTDSGSAAAAAGVDPRRDSVCDANGEFELATRHSDHGLFNCPAGKNPLEWLVSKETRLEATTICPAHHKKFTQALAKVQDRCRTPLPDLAPLLRLLDDMQTRYESNPGHIDSITCGICKSSPYTRLFFSLL
ncbi:hypothetical protein IWQ56_006006 [Coemansia nantahalensis]|nr:hypothetical protein IWQ56_006006 [Coemansia nantahalensis]